MVQKMEGIQYGGGMKQAVVRGKIMVKVRLEKQMKNLTLFSEQPEAMQGLKQTWQQKGVLSDLQVRKITLDAGWNEMARGNMEALRLCKSSPK